ncbi:hypothetical protein LCGC14_0835880 [marine sediment metagenome]|uniref:Uncharacterized protein n=1 Tax=marine sediment metagenome TaxID=412755 RepID=A0A0F9SLT0_9ZZZZ
MIWSFFKCLWGFLRESFQMSREMDNAPDIKVGYRFTASDGIEYMINQVTHYEDSILVLFEPVEPNSTGFIGIGGVEYPVKLDEALALDEWRLERNE